MEMESSRRSLDRSKEPGLLKKPRLGEAGERDPRGVLGAKGTGGERDRPFLPRGGPAGGGPVDPRFRASERERELDQAPSGYRGTSSYQQQQMQELAAQYKTALAELTFNSKPIITNLTIIAGENLHAAKVIVTIVCANILEVPSDQKLPSLYLLDSIVKNIGRDYIKYFAARLPEVFCKAYKQVDSSIHPGMRHLFGTWKGVFPPAPLLIIEKELDFSSIINGSSSGGGSRPDSQAQRPPHSIHVNPKYLEARQQLQQPSRVKGVGGDNIGRAVSTIEDVERPGRVPVIGSSRQWADPSLKNIHQPQRELSNESAREKNPGPGYGDHEFVSDYSWHSDSGMSRASGRCTEREVSNRSWGSAGKNTHEAPLDQRNGPDANHASGNYISGQAIIQPASNKPNATNKSGLITSQNWKNSEEEEYMWDDVNSRLMDPGSSTTSSWSPDDDSDKPTSLRRAKTIVPEIEHLEGKWNKLDTLSQFGKATGKEDRVPSFRGIEGHIPTAHLQHDSGSRADRERSADSLSTGGSVLGHRAPGLWSSQKKNVSLGGLDHLNPRISSQQEGHPIPGSDEVSTSTDVPFSKMRMHFMSKSVATGSLVNPPSASGRMVDKKHQLPLRSPSPSAEASASSVLLEPQNSHNTADCDYLKPQKPMQFPGQLKQAIPSKVNPDLFSPNLHDIQQSDSLSNSQQLLSKISQNVKMSSVSSTPFPQLQHHLPFLQQSDSDLPIQQMQRESHPSIHSQEPLHPPLSFGSTPGNGSSGMSKSINSGGDILDQSSASKLLAAIMKSGLISSPPATSLENLIIQPPLPSGPPPVQVLSAPPSSVPSSAPTPIPHGGYLQTPAANPPIPALPPLPPGPPPPSSLVLTSPQVMNTASANPNPLSSLLSSLVAKGLISSTGTKSSDSANTEMPNEVASQSSILPATTSMPFTTSASSVVPLTSSSSEPLRPESSSPKGDLPSKTVTEEAKGLIGLEFKPEVVREFHPLVIDHLYDYLEHQCIKCGLRFKVEEDINRHFDWHASKSDVGSFDQVSRKWYANSNEWVSRHAETLHGSVHEVLEATVSNPDKCEPMVPADENQCICALCGEPFEDFYCEQRDEWMYKGTVYMNQPDREQNLKHMDKEEMQGPIVHAKCISRNSSHDCEVPIDKMKQAGG